MTEKVGAMVELVLEEAELVWNEEEVKIPERAGLEQG